MADDIVAPSVTTGDTEEAYEAVCKKVASPDLMSLAIDAQIVWGRVDPYPHWPAQILPPEAVQSIPQLDQARRSKAATVPVAFFGEYTYGWLPEKKVETWSEGIQRGFQNKKKFELQMGVREVAKFLAPSDTRRSAPANWWTAPPSHQAIPRKFIDGKCIVQKKKKQHCPAQGHDGGSGATSRTPGLDPEKSEKKVRWSARETLKPVVKRLKELFPVMASEPTPTATADLLDYIRSRFGHVLDIDQRLKGLSQFDLLAQMFSNVTGRTFTAEQVASCFCTPDHPHSFKLDPEALRAIGAEPHTWNLPRLAGAVDAGPRPAAPVSEQRRASAADINGAASASHSDILVPSYPIVNGRLVLHRPRGQKSDHGVGGCGEPGGGGGGREPSTRADLRLSKPPDYVHIRQNVWVSRPKPKRLPRDETSICCCSRPPPCSLLPASDTASFLEEEQLKLEAGVGEVKTENLDSDLEHQQQQEEGDAILVKRMVQAIFAPHLGLLPTAQFIAPDALAGTLPPAGICADVGTAVDTADRPGSEDRSAGGAIAAAMCRQGRPLRSGSDRGNAAPDTGATAALLPRDGCGEGCLNRHSFIHCDPKICPCGDRCSNRPFHQQSHPGMEIFLTPDKGWGVRATEPILPGTFIAEYCGEVVDEVEMASRMEQARQRDEPHFYMMEMAPGLIIDARPKGNIARLLNSSCDPNCETQKWHDAATGEVRVGIFTLRGVAPGEELVYDYHFQQLFGLGSDEGEYSCKCGAANCRGSMDTQPERSKDYGRRVEVWWADDEVYYAGTVTGYLAATQRHTILYDDGISEKLNLNEERYRWLDDIGGGAVAHPPPAKKAKLASTVPNQGLPKASAIPHAPGDKRGRGRALGTAKNQTTVTKASTQAALANAEADAQPVNAAAAAAASLLPKISLSIESSAIELCRKVEVTATASLLPEEKKCDEVALFPSLGAPVSVPVDATATAGAAEPQPAPQDHREDPIKPPVLVAVGSSQGNHSRPTVQGCLEPKTGARYDNDREQIHAHSRYLADVPTSNGTIIANPGAEHTAGKLHGNGRTSAPRRSAAAPASISGRGRRRQRKHFGDEFVHGEASDEEMAALHAQQTKAAPDDTPAGATCKESVDGSPPRTSPGDACGAAQVATAALSPGAEAAATIAALHNSAELPPPPEALTAARRTQASSHMYGSGAGRRSMPTPASTGLPARTILVAKRLTNSDVSKGRILLPRAAVEANLSFAIGRAHSLMAKDHNNQAWEFTLQSWANGIESRRVFVLEHAGDYIRHHALKPEDVIGISTTEAGEFLVEYNTDEVCSAAETQQAARAAGLSNPGGIGGTVTTPLGATPAGINPLIQHNSGRCTRSEHCNKPAGHPGFCMRTPGAGRGRRPVSRPPSGGRGGGRASSGGASGLDGSPSRQVKRRPSFGDVGRPKRSRRPSMKVSTSYGMEDTDDEEVMYSELDNDQDGFDQDTRGSSPEGRRPYGMPDEMPEHLGHQQQERQQQERQLTEQEQKQQLQRQQQLQRTTSGRGTPPPEPGPSVPPIFVMAPDASAPPPMPPHLRSPLRPSMLARQQSLPQPPSVAHTSSVGSPHPSMASSLGGGVGPGEMNNVGGGVDSMLHIGGLPPTLPLSLPQPNHAVDVSAFLANHSPPESSKQQQQGGGGGGLQQEPNNGNSDPAPYGNNPSLTTLPHNGGAPRPPPGALVGELTANRGGGNPTPGGSTSHHQPTLPVAPLPLFGAAPPPNAPGAAHPSPPPPDTGPPSGPPGALGGGTQQQHPADFDFLQFLGREVI